MNDFEKAMKELGHNSHFWLYLEYLYDRREATIKELSDCADGQEKKVAGKLVAYDDMLSLFDWQEIRSRASTLTQ